MAPTGNHTGPPDFVGVGTQRSGTTWWFMSLLEHPQIIAPRYGNKELHFLTRFAAAEMTDQDIKAYHYKFLRGPDQLVGEWTPRYMHDFWTPRLIRRAAPAAKLLIMFRDPLERLRSGVPKEVAVDASRTIDWIIADAIERGRYATQLRRLRAQLPDHEILVLQYEKCVADPATQYRRTLAFLGADIDVPLPDFQRRRGRSRAKEKAELWADMIEAIQVTLADDVRALAAMEDEIDLALWPSFAYLAATPVDA